MDFRMRPNSNYLLNGEWQELYVLTEYWQSDIEYFKDELSFFQVLSEKYFEHLVSQDNINETRAVAALFESVTNEHSKLSAQIDKHLMHIGELLKNPFVQNEPQFRTEHINLENSFMDFVKRFRELKRKLFAIVKRVSKDEKQKHQLTS